MIKPQRPKIAEDKARPWLTCAPTGGLLRPVEVAERVGLSKSQIYVMIREGKFPPFIKIGKRCSRMPEAWLAAFINMRVRLTQENMASGPRTGKFGRPL